MINSIKERGKREKTEPCPECGYPDCYSMEPAKGLFDVFCPHCRFSSDAQTTLEEAVTEWNKLPREEAQKINYDEAEKRVFRSFAWFFIRSLVGIAICFIGFMIADKLLSCNQYWAFGIMFVFGAFFCCTDGFIKKGKR